MQFGEWLEDSGQETIYETAQVVWCFLMFLFCGYHRVCACYTFLQEL